MNHRICAALFAASAAFGLSGCYTDDYGYGGVSIGYGGGYYNGDPYWGWYDDFYYPGAGYYVYDRGGRRYAWNDTQRRYWEGRRGNDWRGNGGRGNDGRGSGWRGRENWNGYRNGMTGGQWQHPQGATGQTWQQRREAWQAQRQAQPQAQSQPQTQSQTQSGTGGAWQGRGNWGGRGGGWGGRRRGQ